MRKAIIPDIAEILLGILDMSSRTTATRHAFEGTIGEPMEEIGLMTSPPPGVGTPALPQEPTSLTWLPISIVVGVQTLVSRLMSWIRRIVFQ
jgi:hypothetical protein